MVHEQRVDDLPDGHASHKHTPLRRGRRMRSRSGRPCVPLARADMNLHNACAYPRDSARLWRNCLAGRFPEGRKFACCRSWRIGKQTRINLLSNRRHSPENGKARHDCVALITVRDRYQDLNETKPLVDKTAEAPHYKRKQASHPTRGQHR